MERNITMGSVTKYFANEEVTIAKLSHVKSIVDEIEDNFGSWDAADIISLCGIGYDGYNNKSFVGKSVCDSRDTYNEKTGKKIASLKADKKYHAHMIRQYESAMTKLEKVYNVMVRNCAKHDDCYYKLCNKLNEYNGGGVE